MPRPNCVLRGLGLRGSATVLIPAFVALPIAVQTVAAAEATPVEASIEQRVQALVPSLEDYIATNMKSFDVRGLAIGIVAGDKLIYAKGFGVRGEGGAPVDTRTIFQIGRRQRRFFPRRWRSPSTEANFIGTTASLTSTRTSRSATHGSRGSFAFSTWPRSAPGCRPMPTTVSAFWVSIGRLSFAPCENGAWP